MAKSATKRAPAAKAPAAARGGAMKPMLLAAGLGLYWFVEHQDAADAANAPVWAYAMIVGVRLLVDFVGALVIVSALRLLLVFGRLAFAHLRGLWLQASGG
jgi:hypothetical protein